MKDIVINKRVFYALAISIAVGTAVGIVVANLTMDIIY